MKPKMERVNRTVELIKKQMLKYHGEDRYEVKKEDLKLIEHTNIHSFVIEVGMRNDEGTYASLMCRDYRHYMIYPLGGVVLVSGQNGLTLKYRKCSGREAIFNPGYTAKSKRNVGK